MSERYIFTLYVTAPSRVHYLIQLSTLYDVCEPQRSAEPVVFSIVPYAADATSHVALPDIYKKSYMISCRSKSPLARVQSAILYWASTVDDGLDVQLVYSGTANEERGLRSVPRILKDEDRRAAAVVIKKEEKEEEKTEDPMRGVLQGDEY